MRLFRCPIFLILATLLLAGSVGCSSDTTPLEGDEAAETPTTAESQEYEGEGYPPNPPEAPAAEEGMRLTATSVEILPGQDVSYCTFVNLGNSEDIYIRGFLPWQTVGGHHATLFIADRHYETGETLECAFDDNSRVGPDALVMPNWQIVAGSVFDKADLFPDGYGFKIPANATLAFNFHYINTTQETIDSHDLIDLYYARSVDGGITLIDSMAGLNTHFRIEPGESGGITSECALQQEISIVSLTGHMHSAGVVTKIWKVDAQGEATPLFETRAVGIDPNQQRIYPVDAPLVIGAGEKIRWSCEWDNEQGEFPLTWPGEMCVVFLHYYVGTGYYICDVAEDGSGTFVPFDEI